MMAGTAMTLGTLAQRIDIDLIQKLLTFAHREQLAGLLALTTQTLKEDRARVKVRLERIGLFKLCYSLSAASRRIDSDRLLNYWVPALVWLGRSPSSWDSDNALFAQSHSAPRPWSASRCSHGSVCKAKQD